MKRKALRRLLRAAEAAGMTVAQYLAWKNRALPDDHPRSEKRPMWSDEQLGRRMISVVERSGTLARVERKMHRRLGRKRHLNAKALLVGVELAAYLMGTYHRAAVCSVLNGLHPDIAKKLGLVDDNGCPIIVKYKVVQSTLKWLERRLRWGWYADDVRCDLAWIVNAIVAASVPRRVRRAATAVVLDSTPVEGYAVPRVFTKQADLNKAAKARLEEAARLENDPYAKHRRDVLNDPDLPEPEEVKGHLAAVAQKLGIKGRHRRAHHPGQRPRHARRVGVSHQEAQGALLRRLRRARRRSVPLNPMAGQPAQLPAQLEGPPLCVSTDAGPRGNQPRPGRLRRRNESPRDRPQHPRSHRGPRVHPQTRILPATAARRENQCRHGSPKDDDRQGRPHHAGQAQTARDQQLWHDHANLGRAQPIHASRGPTPQVPPPNRTGSRERNSRRIRGRS